MSKPLWIPRDFTTGLERDGTWSEWRVEYNAAREWDIWPLPNSISQEDVWRAVRKQLAARYKPGAYSWTATRYRAAFKAVLELMWWFNGLVGRPVDAPQMNFSLLPW